MRLQSWTWLGDWRDTRELALSLASPPKDPARWQPSASREEISPELGHADMLVSDSQLPELWEIHFWYSGFMPWSAVYSMWWQRPSETSTMSFPCFPVSFFIFSHVFCGLHISYILIVFLCNGFLHSFLPWFLDTSSFVLFWWMYLFFYYISN